MSERVARKRLDAFRGQTGDDAGLDLARHAAFPLALTPDLLYRIWARFRCDAGGRELRVPWVAVADLLLSGLCREVGREVFELEPEVRTLLLSELETDPRFGPPRARELAEFLIALAAPDLDSLDPDVQQLARAQRLMALTRLRPQQAAEELASALAGLGGQEAGEQGRVAALVETLARPLPGAALLTSYARAVGHLARGLPAPVPDDLRELARTSGEMVIGSVRVPLPRELLDAVRPAPLTPPAPVVGQVVIATTVRYAFNLLCRSLVGGRSLGADSHLGWHPCGERCWEVRVYLVDSPEPDGVAERVRRIISEINPINVFLIEFAYTARSSDRARAVVASEVRCFVSETEESVPTPKSYAPSVEWLRRARALWPGGGTERFTPLPGTSAVMGPVVATEGEDSLRRALGQEHEAAAVSPDAFGLSRVLHACRWTEWLFLCGVNRDSRRNVGFDESWQTATHEVCDLALALLTEEGDILSRSKIPHSISWGLARLGIPELWERGLTGRGVDVGLVDSGVDVEHPALGGAVGRAVRFDEQGRRVEILAPRGGVDHGTMSAGILVGRRFGRMICGVAPYAGLAAADVLPNGLQGTNASIGAGLDWILGQSVRVVCVPLGFRDPGLSENILSLIASRVRDAGVLLVCPTGNEGPGVSHAPGNSPHVLSVGWSTQEDKVADISSSQRFERDEKPLVPDLVAPGVDILCPKPGGEFDTISGGSPAVALVAGLAALLFQAKPTATADEVEAAILGSCERPPGMDPERGNHGIPYGPRALDLLLGRTPSPSPFALAWPEPTKSKKRSAKKKGKK